SQGMDPAARERNSVRISARAVSEDRVSIEVTDNGPTPSAEELARIFDPELLSAKPGTVGQSLAVGKQMVEAMEGKIVAEPLPSGGMIVRVTLPAAERVSEVTAKVPTQRTPATVRPRILVVDDEPMVTWSVRRVLGKDWDVVVAHSGEEALALVAAPGATFD